MAVYENAPNGTEFANQFSDGSRLLKLLPPLDRLIVGRNNVPTGWHVLHDTAADEVAPEDDWIAFEGDPTATKLPVPRLAKYVGLMAVEGTEMAELRERTPAGLDGVALRFQDAVVVGPLTPGMTFGSDPRSPLELVGARILHEGIRALPVRLLGRASLSRRWSPGIAVPASAGFYRRTPISEVDPRVPIA